MNENDLISVKELKDMIFDIREEYIKENKFNNDVDYIVNEIVDGINNIVYLKNNTKGSN